MEVRGPKIRLDPSIGADRVKRLDALRNLVAKHIDRAHAKQKRLYDQGRKDVTFGVGDMVMQRTHPLSDGKKGFSAKMAEKFDGPFSVAEVLGPTTYRLDVGAKRTNPKVHVEHLKPPGPTCNLPLSQ
ncbi:hypothetical protein TKK_0012481 [Trichogramma kaykai]|uniref:Tf2-1-like SH3-like domain-containing protein n=1 Tax=Trichogramma kaykai TaxID=54128 RepID=A0ABD2WNM9_9HYME